MAASSSSAPPSLVSDVRRSFVVAISALIVTFAIAFALIGFGVVENRSRITASSILIAWTAMAIGTSLVTWIVFRRASGGQLNAWLAATTPDGRFRRIVWSLNGGGGISWAITGSAIAIIAIVLIGQNSEFRSDPLVVVPAIAVVASSVLMIISAYTIHYARENTRLGGLVFPERIQPRFVDYFYLAVQVSTTFSTSDVTVTSSSMRRTVAVHSLTAFAFNTVIVALLVSMLIVVVS